MLTDLLWLRDLLLELGIVLGTPPLIMSDSASAIAMSLDPIAFKNIKHILRAAEFLRDLVMREAVAMKHVVLVKMSAIKSVGDLDDARSLHRSAAPH